MRYFGVAVAVVFCVLGLTAHVAVAADVQVSPTVSYADFSAIDAGLAAQGINARLDMVEYTTRPDSGQYGGTIFARNVGNKQLAAHWVPNDPWRRGDRYITYAIDGTELYANPGLDEGLVIGAIDSAMETWDDVACSTIPIYNVGIAPFDLGVVQYLVGLGGYPGWLADITHAGWLDAAFFDAVAPPNGSQYIIGATFTFIWIDDVSGEPTDMDRNGKLDLVVANRFAGTGCAQGDDWKYFPESSCRRSARQCKLSLNPQGWTVA